MGIAKDLLDTDLAYSAWANRRLLDACSALTLLERTRDFGQSHHSVLFTLHHVYEGERFWLGCLRQNEMPPMETIRPPDTPPEPRLEEMEHVWPEVWEGYREWLASVPEEELGRTLSCRLASGTDFHFTRWQLVRHVVNHSTLHRGQIVGMLRAMDKRPPSVDLTTYYVTR